MNFVTFNQDYSCLAVGTSALSEFLSNIDLLLILGTSRGFRIYHTDPFAKIFSSDDGNVAIIEMLFSTSLVALILSPRHLVIQNTKVSSSNHGTFRHSSKLVGYDMDVDYTFRDPRSSASLPFPLQFLPSG